MCGISAIVTGNNQTSIDCIFAMTQAISHRGPDDEGYLILQDLKNAPLILGGESTPLNVYCSSYPYAPKKPYNNASVYKGIAALGHRRLSIVDLSAAGHQPMCTPDEQVWITYNGEIYNYLEVRNELVALGVSFKTQSDTEVILAAYRYWGIQCLEHFNGMFAFVLLDRLKNKVFAVRDRFGVKPLYYWRSPNGYVAFASEIKQFTTLPGWNPIVNGQQAYAFLHRGTTDHTNETMFQNVFQVRGGEYLECALEGNQPHHIKIHRWYTLKPTPYLGDFEEASSRFLQLIEDSISLRLRADVDVGSCLSGGLDSSTIVCLANRNLRNQSYLGRQKTFSACSHISRFDERNFIENVIEYTEVDAYYTYPCLDKLFKDLPEITWHQDEPFGSTSIYAQWEVFQMAKQNGVKVMLDGQGADEQLAGYHGFFGHFFYDLLKTKKIASVFKEANYAYKLHGINPIPQIIKTLIPFQSLRRFIRKIAGKNSYQTDWINLEKLNASKKELFNTYASGVQELSIQQLYESSLPMLLRYEDRDSMAHSVESRTPFLDYRLVEFTTGLPSSYKIQNGMTKSVLRESMKGVIPEKIRTRVDKIAFATAEEVWMKQQNPQLFRNAVDKTLSLSNGVINSQVNRELEEILIGKQPFTHMIWRIISFGEWLEKFAVKI